MNTSANEVIDRLGIVMNVKNDSELCKLLNLARTTVSTWRGRDSVPYSLCVKIAQEKEVSLDWLLTGHGAIYRNQTPAYSEDSIDHRHAALLSLYDALAEDQQREILTNVQEKERLNRVEEQLGDLLKKLG
jgi:transcriptional regulator with XRE-family HTH domain